MSYKVGLTFEFVDKTLCVTIQIKAIEQYFPAVLINLLYKVVQAFESVDEILKCYHSYESYCAVLSCGTICFSAFSKIIISVTIQTKVKLHSTFT